ncbi:SIS domain-containing protein [Saxibacter everestensis]|uniref:SIS domain-containing protein n=1 Tax=Saxibacter everestensis TaxID=2909229 RepID=A0ABY8QW78_9MICO|nr:SIS domain-containing protein [Brevibacteriaceae bacterium ZFBP1038]
MIKTVQGRGVVGMQDSIVEDVADVATGATFTAVRRFVADYFTSSTSVIYLVGCGGSLYMFGAMKYLLDDLPVPVITINSAELVARRPAGLGQNSLVIASSTHGTTMETAEAITVARSSEAPVLLVCQNVDSPCAAAAEHIINHNGVEAKQVLLAVIAHELLDTRHVVPRSLPAPDVLAGLGPVFRETNVAWDRELEAVATSIAHAELSFVIGSGPNEGAIDTFASCYLMEMQNLAAVASGANDFLHGTHEMIDDDSTLLVLVGEDSTREIAERAAEFARRFSRKTSVLDTAELPMTGVVANHRSTVSALLFASSVIARLAQRVEAVTEVPLISRKYMWKATY